MNFFRKIFNIKSHDDLAIKEITNANYEDNSKGYIEKAKLEFESKNYSSSLVLLDKAINLDKNNALAFIERSKVKRLLNDLNGATNDLQVAKKLMTYLDEGLKYNDIAGEEYDKENYQEAIKNYTKAFSYLPSLSGSYLYSGLSKLYLEDYNGALEDFNKSIGLNSSNKADAYNNRSEIKSLNLNDKKGAIEDLNEAINIDPNEELYYYNRSLLQKGIDKIRDLDSAITINKSNPEYYLSRCIAKTKIEDYNGGIDDITKYIELNEITDLTISEAYSLRAGLRIYLDDIEGSLNDHNLAIKTDNRNANAILDRGIIYDILNKKEEALLDFDKAIELNKELADAYFHRGVLKQSIGMEDDGVMDVIRAKSMGFVEN